MELIADAAGGAGANGDFVPGGGGMGLHIEANAGLWPECLERSQWHILAVEDYNRGQWMTGAGSAKTNPNAPTKSTA